MRATPWITYLCCAALVVLSVLETASAAVMSIDYGTEWFKVGLIKPGIPLDVALNKDSKRKTQTVVLLRGVERSYGSDAVSVASRFPQWTYANLKSIAGKPFEDKHCVEYRQRFVNTMISDPERGVPLFQHDDTRSLSVEELIAYQFQNARQQAKNAAGEDVRDVVITVAPYATQSERQAIVDAAELAGLNVLSLMHDETAVALNYAINREFTSEPEYHIFYDMGAGSTVASLVSFANVEVKEGKSKRTVPQLQVHSVGFDRTLGGHEFDVRLQNLLADKFMEKAATSDIRQSESAMTRLAKEANRVKQILSANTETYASIESLHEDVDFKAKVTRAELETLCKDLIDRVPGPILAALDASGMKLDDIKSLVLVGGGVRVPSIQYSLSSIVGSQKIAKNVNGDEAAVLGAAFRGATLSNQFRLTKQIKIKDITVFPVDVAYTAEDGSSVKTTLFDEFGAIGTRKTMTFKRTTDFDFELTYGKSVEQQDHELGLHKIAKVEVAGLTEAMQKYAEEIQAAEQPAKVRVAVEYSASGLVSIPEASLQFEVKDSGRTLKDKVKSFFGGKDGAEKEEQDKQEDEQTASTAQNNKNNSSEPAEEPKTSLKKIPLKVTVIPTGPKPMTEGAKLVARQRMKELDLLDEQRRLREESRNNLESFVYRAQEFLYDDTVAVVSTEEEQEKLRELLSETSDWLYDEGENADTAANVERLRKLRALEQPIAFRRTEYLNRADNLKKIDDSVALARNFVSTIRATNEEDRYHTDEELNGLSDLAARVEAWKSDKVKAQEALAAHVSPVLTTAECKRKCQELEEALFKLMQKKKPKAKKPKADKAEQGEKTEKAEKEDKQDKENETEEQADGKAEDKPEEKKPQESEEHEHDEL